MDILYKMGAILGLLAFFQVSQISSRLRRLERDGVSAPLSGRCSAKEDIAKVLAPCIGKEVVLDFYEDEVDRDLICATGKRKIILLDIDSKWAMVRMETPKTHKDKLIRISSIKGVSYQE